MNKIGQYLQQHVTGEVIESADIRHAFAADASIFTLTPSLVLYPRSEQDVRKAARFIWQLAERGRIVPITARGAGTDQSGAAIGSGMIMAFPAHLNRILELDAKSGTVVVEPGLNYGTLQQTLETHGRFLPPYPASAAYSTIGGAVANNAGGEKSLKYGDTRAYVRGLRVVLANGEVIVTERLSKRELSKKLGSATFEGEIYRSLDALLEEHKSTVDSLKRHVTKDTAGYDLLDIKHKDGSFDLTPLFVGSQGTLGIVTEITLDTEPYNPETTLLVAGIRDLPALQAAVLELRQGDTPSAMEVVDGNLLAAVTTLNPSQLRGLVEAPLSAFSLLVEYDTPGRSQKKTAHKAAKILAKYTTTMRTETDPERQAALWRLREASAMVLAHGQGAARALPLLDGAVPAEKLQDLIVGTYDILERNRLPAALWGHAGDGQVHIQPYLDVAQLGDRQKAFRLLDEYHRLVISLGGTVSGENGDGRLRAPYLEQQYGTEAYGLFRKVKDIFDPHHTLNPGVKIGVKLDDIKPLMRQQYSLAHLAHHLPRN
ncbi:MAG TPA: FAD-binding oxidoreductase [Candidatus Saccharimonadales bacterium]|nr:FAD-binding oxidoreductase [Candidatus Saccharimonadales bacterium]